MTQAAPMQTGPVPMIFTGKRAPIERPIILHEQAVRAILAGKKTQTRIPVNPAMMALYPDIERRRGSTSIAVTSRHA